MILSLISGLLMDKSLAPFSGVIWPTVNGLIAGSSRGRDWYHAAFRANKFAISVEEFRRIVALSQNLPDPSSAERCPAERSCQRFVKTSSGFSST